MRACPGLRSGIDRSGSLSFAIRGIPSSIRPPIRHSGEGLPRTPIRGRNPGGVERAVALGLVPSLGRTARSHKLHRPASHRFHPLMRPSQGHGDSRQPSFTRIDEIYQFCRQRRVHGGGPAPRSSSIQPARAIALHLADSHHRCLPTIPEAVLASYRPRARRSALDHSRRRHRDNRPARRSILGRPPRRCEDRASSDPPSRRRPDSPAKERTEFLARQAARPRNNC